MKTINPRSTKSEILAAYNAAVRELKAAKTQRPAPPPGPMKALPPSPSEPEPSGETSIAGIILRLRGLTTNIGESASALQGELTTEATTLAQLRAQAEQVTTELGALHGIEVTDATLGELVARYGGRREATDLELQAQREALDKELSAARAEWQQEQEAHARKAKETARELELARKRDAEEYGYARQRSTEQQQDERAQAKLRFELEQVELRERKAQEWKERELELARREQEYAELQAKDQAFDGERDTATKRAEQEGMAIARRQTKAQADLRTKDYDGTRRVFELEIGALEDTLAKQDAQLAELSRQLESARKQTTELAIKAIDGSSNASSFAAIKEIALEQAKNSTKSK